MPYRFDVEPDARVIRKTVWGVYDDTQAVQAIQDFAAIEGYEHFDELHDLLGVTRYDVSSVTMRRIAAESSALAWSPARPNRVALVVPHDLVHGMARMYQGFHDGEHEELQIFRDVEAAEAWLLGEGHP